MGREVVRLACEMLGPLDSVLDRVEQLLDELPIDDLPADAAILSARVVALRRQVWACGAASAVLAS